MASVQMSFAIMPAAVYWFAGESIASGGHAISIGTVVAFTYGVPTYDRVSTVAAEPLPAPGISTKPGTGALFVVSVNV